jgi:sugar-specific transcriptional regulator TrmB
MIVTFVRTTYRDEGIRLDEAEMALERLSERLLDFGFTKEEAEIYVFLSSMGPTPARLIARRFDINRMKAYRTLKALEEKRLVERIIGRPMRFVAAPLEESLKRHIVEIKTHLSDLEAREKEIVEDLKRLTEGAVDRLEEPRLRFYQGRQQIYDLLIQMCERADEEICIVTTRSDLHRLALMGFDERLRVLDREGKRVRILTQIEGPEFEEVYYFIEFAEVRHVPLPTPVRFVTVDDRETLTTTSMDDTMSMTTQDDTGLWTNAQSYTSAMKVFFDALWRLASVAHARIEALRSGTITQEIRIIRAQNDYVETFRMMMNTCESSLQLMVGKVDDLPMPIEDILGSLNNEAEIKILTQLDLDSLQKLSDVIEAAEVMHSLSTFDLHLLIVDDKEALMSFPSTPSIERAVWSNMGAYVETMNNVFMDYWNRGEPAGDIISRLATQRDYLERSNAIKSSLELSGWHVQAPGSLTGSSGLEHTFNLVATNPERSGESIAIDILIEETAFNHIIRLGAKSMDLKPTMLLLSSGKPFKEQERDLAKLYGIKLVHDEKTDMIAEKINGLAVDPMKD